MKILQIHNSYREPGGEDVSVDTEAKILHEAGHEVRQYTVRNPDRFAPTLSALARAPVNRAAARQVIEVAREFRPNVAHVHNTWFSISPLVLDALAAAAIPTVLTLRNYRVACMQAMLFRDGRICTDCIGRSPLPGIRHRCYRGSVALSAVAGITISAARRRGSWAKPRLILALSESAKRVLVDAGLEPERIAVVPNAVLDPGRRPAPPSKSNRLLFVGRLTEEKGPDTLVEAWRRLGDRGGLELVLLGDGPLRGELEPTLPCSARLLGHVDRATVNEQMLGARALLFPSRSIEPFGRGAAEAFAAGLPVLGSDRGATGEIVAGLGPDWMVGGDNADAWVEAIARLADGGRVDATGARAREIYEHDFAPPVAASRLEEVYERAIDQR